MRRPPLLLLGLVLVALGFGVGLLPEATSAGPRALAVLLRLGLLLPGLALVVRGRPFAPATPTLLKVALVAFVTVALTGALAALVEPVAVPHTHLFPALRGLHPVLAATAGMLVGLAILLVGTSSESPGLRRRAAVAGACFVAQLGVGFVNLPVEVSSLVRVAHGLLALALWASLMALAAPVSEREGAP